MKLWTFLRPALISSMSLVLLLQLGWRTWLPLMIIIITIQIDNILEP
jgi:hypothetical protein